MKKMLFSSDFFYENALKIGKFNLILRVQIIDYKWVIPHFSQLRGGNSLVFSHLCARYVRVCAREQNDMRVSAG